MQNERILCTKLTLREERIDLRRVLHMGIHGVRTYIQSKVDV